MKERISLRALRFFVVFASRLLGSESGREKEKGKEKENQNWKEKSNWNKI